MRILWKNDKRRFGLEERVRNRDGVPVRHLHLIVFHWNICLSNFPEDPRHIDPIALFYNGLCKR